jgi:hypothetical protein
VWSFLHRLEPNSEKFEMQRLCGTLINLLVIALPFLHLTHITVMRKEAGKGVVRFIETLKAATELTGKLPIMADTWAQVLFATVNSSTRIPDALNCTADMLAVKPPLSVDSTMPSPKAVVPMGAICPILPEFATPGKK